MHMYWLVWWFYFTTSQSDKPERSWWARGNGIYEIIFFKLWMYVAVEIKIRVDYRATTMIWDPIMGSHLVAQLSVRRQWWQLSAVISIHVHYWHTSIWIAIYITVMHNEFDSWTMHVMASTVYNKSVRAIIASIKWWHAPSVYHASMCTTRALMCKASQVSYLILN